MIGLWRPRAARGARRAATFVALASLTLLPAPALAARGGQHHAKAASDARSVTISPLPGTPDASPRTQISFLGVPLKEITHVSVIGSRSGRHSGKLRAYVSAAGASFLPSKGFVQGEHVTVTALVGREGSRKRVSSVFTIARLFRYKFPPKSSQKTATSGPTVQSFVSQPSLHPTPLSVTVNSPHASAGDVFFAYNGGSAAWGPTIFSGSGSLIWFHPVPSTSHAMDFKVTQYDGEPALVWWQGYVPSIGIGFGQDEIYNDHYEHIATVRAGNGYHADLHEVLITPAGQAYTTAYTLVRANLSSVHGSANGPLLDAIVQEVDIKTGLVMFEWHAYGHIAFSESYSKPSSNPNWPFDFFHVNSISLDPWGDGNFLISARNTWAGYEINHRTGTVSWRLGGKRSTFKMGPGTQTAYQHDIRWHPDHTITAFDDGSSPQVHPQSRVIHERIDWQTKTVQLISQDVHSPKLVANSQGNDELLEDGDSFVGWGAQPYFSEFGLKGEVLFDAKLPAGESYRAYRFPWNGTPSEKPSVAVRTGAGNAIDVYASWNGATEVASWRVLAWNDAKHVEILATAPATGFETEIPVETTDSWIAAQPLNAAGEILATSRPVKGS